jgi:peptidoglycan/xylan/chitin deacetylase (PgdA/CDA1 family)
MHVGIESQDGPALPALIAGLREQGYGFVSLVDLLAS